MSLTASERNMTRMNKNNITSSMSLTFRDNVLAV